MPHPGASLSIHSRMATNATKGKIQGPLSENVEREKFGWQFKLLGKNRVERALWNNQFFLPCS